MKFVVSKPNVFFGIIVNYDEYTKEAMSQNQTPDSTALSFSFFFSLPFSGLQVSDSRLGDFECHLLSFDFRSD